MQKRDPRLRRGGPAIPVGPPVPQVVARYHIKKSSADVPATLSLYHQIYSPAAVSILLDISAVCRKKKDVILNRSAPAVKGLTSNDKRHIRTQMAQYATLPDVEKAARLHALVEGYLITDPNHHCLQHNLQKLQGLDVRVNGERGLRAKQKLFPHQLLGAYNGEVLVQKEYDDSLEYDFTLGDNVRDDKTFTLWSPEDQEDDPSKELVIVGRLACNPLALTNDPTGSGHAPNVFVVSAWNQHTEEVDMYYFVGKDGVQQGQELWLDYGQEFRRHILHDEPARLASILMLKGDIKALEDEKLHLRAELQGAYLDREGDSGKIKGLQAYIEECKERTCEMQRAQTQEASRSKAAEAQLHTERACWRDERQEWVAENGTLWAQVAREEKKRLTERNVAIFEIAEAASAQQAAEDKVKWVTMQMDALEAAHDAPFWPHQDVLTALQGQVDDLHAELRWTKRQLAEVTAALAGAQQDHGAEVSAREHLARELNRQLQALEADNKQLRAASSGEAETRAAAARARAEAAAHTAAAEARQLKAVLAAQSADLEKAHKQCTQEARRQAAAAAEMREMQEACAQKDAALRSAEAAAHQAATRVAKLMQRDAPLDDTADQQPSCADSQDPDVSSAAGGLSSENSHEEQTDSEGDAELGEETYDQHQLQQAGGNACVEDAQLGSEVDMDEVPEASTRATKQGMASMPIVPDHGVSPPTCLNRVQQVQEASSSPTASETSKHGATCPHDQHGFGLAPLTGEDPAEPGQLGSERSHSRDRDGSARHRSADCSTMPSAHGKRRRSSSYSPARRPSPSRHRSWGRAASVLQRSRSTSDRHRCSPSQSHKRQRSCSPLEDRHTGHRSRSGPARQEPHEDSRRHCRPWPANHQRSNISKDVGDGAMPSWGPPQFAGLGQHEGSMLGNSLGRERVDASAHAASPAKQELTGRGTSWLLAGETHEDRFKNTLRAAPSMLGMRSWLPRKKTKAQKRADKREYERSFQISSSVAQHYRGALKNAYAQEDVKEEG